MRRCVFVVLIAGSLLVSASESRGEEISLQYKFEGVNFLRYQFNLGIKIERGEKKSGPPIEIVLTGERVMIKTLSGDEAHSFIASESFMLKKAAMGPVDARDMFLNWERFTIVNYTLYSDGVVKESPEAFENRVGALFFVMGSLPPVPLEKGVAWRHVLQFSQEIFDITWKLMEPKSRNDCIELEASIGGRLALEENVTLNLLNGQLKNCFDQKAGISVRQTLTATADIIPADKRAIAMNVTVGVNHELVEKQELPADKLSQLVAILELVRLGQVELKAGNYPAAMAKFEEVLQKYPNNYWRPEIETLKNQALKETR